MNPNPDSGNSRLGGAVDAWLPRLPAWVKTLLGLLLVAATFYFLGSRLVRDWHQIPFSELRFRPIPLIGAFLLFGIHFFFYGYAWRALLIGLGYRLGWLASTSIWAVTQLGKYVPGKVWFTLGRIELANRKGIPRAAGFVSVLLEAGFALLSAVLLFGLALLFVPHGQVPPAAYILLSLIPICLVVLYPPVLNRLVAYFLGRLRRPTFRLQVSYPRLVWISAVYTFDWLIQALGCYIMVNSFYPLPLSSLPVLIGGYAVSWILGFLSLVTPAGLGVREGIFTFILRMVLLQPLAIVAALLTRVWVTLGELVAALAFAPFLGRQLKDGSKEETV